MRLRLPDSVRAGSDETLALLLSATLCASGPGSLLGLALPPPRYLPPAALGAIGVLAIGVFALRHRDRDDVVPVRARVGAAGLVFVVASATIALLMSWRADAWFAPEPLYEATAFLLGVHVAGLVVMRFGPRLPARMHTAQARSLALGASAARLARASVRGALGWLALFWSLVAIGLLHVSVVPMLLAIGCVAATLPLRLLIAAVGMDTPSPRSARGPRREITHHAASA